MTHEIAIETIKSMPRDFNVDELIEWLIVIEKIKEAEEDVAAGRTTPNSEVQKIFEEWKR